MRKVNTMYSNAKRYPNIRINDSTNKQVLVHRSSHMPKGGVTLLNLNLNLNLN